jgi:hypothetical protein
VTEENLFDEKLAQWQAWCEAPWGRLRFTVVSETLRRQTETLAATGRKLTVEEIEAEMSTAGLDVVGRYAARVANDYVTDDGLKDDPTYFAALERLELALCDREPYVRLGGMWQLVGEAR